MEELTVRLAGLIDSSSAFSGLFLPDGDPALSSTSSEGGGTNAAKEILPVLGEAKFAEVAAPIAVIEGGIHGVVGRAKPVFMLDRSSSRGSSGAVDCWEDQSRCHIVFRRNHLPVGLRLEREAERNQKAATARKANLHIPTH